MSKLKVAKPFDPWIASALTFPNVLILIHFAIVLTIQMQGNTSSLGQEPRLLLIISGLFLTPIALVCGVWAVAYSVVRSGAASRRYPFIAFNIVPVGIVLLYVFCILCIAAIGPINPG